MRREWRRKTAASRERDELLAADRRSDYLAALGREYPEAVEPAKAYLATLDNSDPDRTHKFVMTHQRTGRIESYHHFLGALFYPLVLHAKEFGFESKCVLHVQDCGSLNRHLHALAEQIGLEIRVFPAEMTSSLAKARADEVLRLPPFDASNSTDKWFHDHEIEAIRSFGFEWVPCDAAPDIPVLVVSRGESDPHFSSSRFVRLYPNHTEWNHTGSSRRHITNEDEMIEAISKVVAPRVAELEEMDFREQISLFRRARIIVAQHGAGLNGLMWCRPGACVLEILPYEKLGDPDTYFRNMARQLGLRHSYMIQNGEHGRVDASAVGRYVARLQASPLEKELAGPHPVRS